MAYGSVSINMPSMAIAGAVITPQVVIKNISTTPITFTAKATARGVSIIDMSKLIYPGNAVVFEGSSFVMPNSGSVTVAATEYYRIANGPLITENSTTKTIVVSSTPTPPEGNTDWLEVLNFSLQLNFIAGNTEWLEIANFSLPLNSVQGDVGWLEILNFPLDIDSVQGDVGWLEAIAFDMNLLPYDSDILPPNGDGEEEGLPGWVIPAAIGIGVVGIGAAVVIAKKSKNK